MNKCSCGKNKYVKWGGGMSVTCKECELKVEGVLILIFLCVLASMYFWK